MNTTVNSPVVRRAQEDDIPQLAAFYQRFHPHRTRLQDMTAWRWEFLANPYIDKDAAFFVLETGGRIHGGIGYVPVQLQVADRVLKAGHPVNFFIDPAYKGLPALRLLRACLRECPVAFAGYVSDDAARLFKAAGFIDLSQYLRHYHLPLCDGGPGGGLSAAKRLARIVLRKTLIAGARGYCFLRGGRGDVNVSEQPPSADAMPTNTSNPARHFRVIKDAQYINWRYAQSPVLNCRYVTLREGGINTALAVVHLDPAHNQAVILDIIASSPRLPQLLSLLLHTIQYCMDTGLALLSSVMMHPDFDSAYKYLGFGSTRSEYRFMVYAEDKALKQELSAHQKWEFVLGDTDRY
jgi:hypothetical protein